MKKSYFLIVGIVFAMFLLSSCDGSSNGTATRGNPYRGGTESVALSFEQNMPPSETFSDISFDVAVKIRNTGEFIIPANTMSVRLEGFNHQTYGLTNPEQTVDRELRGTVYDVDRNVIQGDEEFIEFSNLRYGADLSVTLADVPIRAVVCYPYGTTANSNICIKRNVNRDNPGDVCAVNEQKTVHVSSGPVQVTSLQQSPRGSGSIAFNFQVEHKGVGELYSNTDDSCSDERERNKVLVTVNAPSGTSCSTLGGGTSGVITLTPGSGRLVTCTLDVSATSSDFVQEISVDLRYNYRQTITRTINIKPAD